MLRFTSGSRSICLTGLVLAALPVVAQTPDSVAAPARPQGTLIKLGTGVVTPGFELGGYRGLYIPLLISIEHHLTSGISLYGNGFSGFRVTNLYNSTSDYYRSYTVGNYGFEAGIRRYYNQEKRRQKGMVTGPFVGNYVALQASSVFRNSFYRDYRYSGLTALWGTQRRMGKYGWFDAYAGAGVGHAGNYYSSNNYYGLLLELGLKFSLGNRFTR